MAGGAGPDADARCSSHSAISSPSRSQSAAAGSSSGSSASAASALLVLRSNMASSRSTASALVLDAGAGVRKRKSMDMDGKQDMDEVRRVHEITESSSEESADEADVSVAPRAVIPTSPPLAGAGSEEVVIQEYYDTRTVADMHYLFTNDKLKVESAATVLSSDPYCIPRVSDNVANYRPKFNPLNILMAEEKFLPGYFRLDPTEGVPGASQGDKDAAAVGDATNLGLLGKLRRGSSSNPSGTFVSKSTAFMGTMPRQQEFLEFPISENIFHSFKTAPPSPRHGMFANKMYQGGAAFPPSDDAAISAEEDDSGALRSAETQEETTASLSDAVLLSSIQHTVDTPAASGSAAMMTTATLTGSLEPLYASSTADMSSLQPIDSTADTLKTYLPSRQAPRSDHLFGDYLDETAAGYSLFGAPPASAQPDAASFSGLFVDDASSTATSLMSPASLSTAATPPADSRIRSSLQPVAKKPRAKNVFRPCTAPGCTKGARGKSGLCQRHGGGRRCSVPNCPKGAQGSSNLCLSHGGGYRCTFEGCKTGARGTSGLCAKHGGYKKGKDGDETGSGDEEGESVQPKVKRAKK